jgi:thioredoxin-related protein
MLTTAQDWKESYGEALSISEKEAKPLVLVFAGSDWCAPCIKLEKSIWQSEEFASYAKENYVLYKADFPRKKNNQLPEAMADQNKILAQQFNPKGYFPLVVVLNSDEKVLGETGYKKLTPNQYISLLNSFVE